MVKLFFLPEGTAPAEHAVDLFGGNRTPRTQQLPQFHLRQRPKKNMHVIRHDGEVSKGVINTISRSHDPFNCVLCLGRFQRTASMPTIQKTFYTSKPHVSDLFQIRLAMGLRMLFQPFLILPSPILQSCLGYRIIQPKGNKVDNALLTQMRQIAPAARKQRIPIKILHRLIHRFTVPHRAN